MMVSWRGSWLALALLLTVLTGSLESAPGSTPSAAKSPRPGPQQITDSYFDQFRLDYGSTVNTRPAGSLRAFLKTGSLTQLPEKDKFLRWLYNHLERGPQPIKDRLKPFHAVDFGTRKDLQKGECPTLIIVNRRLVADPATGHLASPPSEVDVEVRKIWQPWLRRKCDFVVRYIVPDRVNLCRILGAKNRFRAEVEKKAVGDNTQINARLIFRPSPIERLLGKRDIVITQPLDSAALLPTKQ